MRQKVLVRWVDDISHHDQIYNPSFLKGIPVEHNLNMTQIQFYQVLRQPLNFSIS